MSLEKSSEGALWPSPMPKMLYICRQEDSIILYHDVEKMIRAKETNQILEVQLITYHMISRQKNEIAPFVMDYW